MTKPTTAAANDEPEPREEEPGGRADALFDKQAVGGQLTPTKWTFFGHSSTPSGSRLSTALALATMLIPAAFCAVVVAFIGWLLAVSAAVCFPVAILVGVAVVALYVRQTNTTPTSLTLINTKTGEIEGRMSVNPPLAAHARPVVRTRVVPLAITKGKGKGKGKNRGKSRRRA